MYGYNQPNIDRINAQMQELEKIKQQLQQPQPSINQTFQLTPNHQNGIKYVENEKDVLKEIVYMDTLFVNKAFTNLWFKKINGEVKKYQISEIVELDEKDLKIQELEKQVKKLMEAHNEQYINSDIDGETVKVKPSNVSISKQRKTKQC